MTDRDTHRQRDRQADRQSKFQFYQKHYYPMCFFSGGFHLKLHQTCGCSVIGHLAYISMPIYTIPMHLLTDADAAHLDGSYVPALRRAVLYTVLVAILMCLLLDKAAASLSSQLGLLLHIGLVVLFPIPMCLPLPCCSFSDSYVPTKICTLPDSYVPTL